MSQITLRTPQLLQIRHGAGFTYGASQEWFKNLWQQRAGCGPTACAQLLWYLSRTRPGCRALCPYDGARREGFVSLMEEVWEYVTPGRHGVNTTSILTQGAVRFGERRGVALDCRVLEVPGKLHQRPPAEKLSAFIAGALADDLPVAFLNLSNGTLQNLDSWHWVTLVSYDTESTLARMYDQGGQESLDMEMWLRTTTLGGGLVALEPAT